jgi:membrane-bound metal-dependent hydrolase YbcI (DUF457 family)
MHKSYDYTTSAKMRPFYPFSINESALRAIYPFDPIVNFFPLLPLLVVAAESVKNKNRSGAINPTFRSIFLKINIFPASVFKIYRTYAVEQRNQ